MPLPASYGNGAVFIGHVQPNSTSLTIGGTGFLVNVPAAPHRGVYQYVVTAGHVIDHAPVATVRGRSDAGTYDLEVRDWVTHPKYDVSVALIAPPRNSIVVATDLSQFVDAPHWREDKEWGAPFDLELGDIVYLVGLLTNVKAMVDKCIPVARTGAIAQSWQTQLPVQQSPDHDIRYITAHLIDCISFGGMSGAPCYIQQSRAGFFPETASISTRYRTALLGLIGGHFDNWSTVRTSIKSLNPARSRTHTGIGYVIPAEHIRATLEFEDVIDDRDRRGSTYRTGDILPDSPDDPNRS